MTRSLKGDRSPGQGWALPEIWVLWAVPTHCFRRVGERPQKRQRAGNEWVFGERFECAAGFPHSGSGRPEVGVGEGCIGVENYPSYAVWRWSVGKGGSLRQGWVRSFLDSICRKENLGHHLHTHKHRLTHTASGRVGVKARLGPG